jgi:hypothetical protein
MNKYSSLYFEGKQTDVAYCLIIPYLLVGLRKKLSIYKIDEKHKI